MRFGLREFIFLIVLLSVPIASFVFVFKPRNDEIRQAREEIDEKQEKLARLDEVSTRIDDIGKAIDEWREAVQNIEQKLPSEQGVDEILEQVWTLTSKNHLTIVATHAEAAVPTSTYMELPLKIEMTGDFDAFYQFLLELEQLNRITRIHQLHIARAGLEKRRGRSRDDHEEIPDGAMEADFVLSIFYQPNSGAQRGIASAQ
jgi:type IV pilus assembly protein PilO